MATPIILLSEGTEQRQGKRQILGNISACQVVADSIRTTLGPRGLDKLVVDRNGFVQICINISVTNGGVLQAKQLYRTTVQLFSNCWTLSIRLRKHSSILPNRKTPKSATVLHR
jgi:hypothetical protein